MYPLTIQFIEQGGQDGRWQVLDAITGWTSSLLFKAASEAEAFARVVLPAAYPEVQLDPEPVGYTAPSRPQGGLSYSGHGATTGGLQAHSVGELYPLAIVFIERGALGGQWHVLDTRSGSTSRGFHSYRAAEIEAWGRRVLGLIHS